MFVDWTYGTRLMVNKKYNPVNYNLIDGLNYSVS